MSNDFMLHSLASETVESLSDFKLDSMRGTANESSQISLVAKVLKSKQTRNNGSRDWCLYVC